MKHIVFKKLKADEQKHILGGELTQNVGLLDKPKLCEPLSGPTDPKTNSNACTLADIAPGSLPIHCSGC